MPDVSPLRNVKFCISLDFAAAKDFVNIFSTKYYFTNYLEITLAEAKFGTPCCVNQLLVGLFWTGGVGEKDVIKGSVILSFNKEVSLFVQLSFDLLGHESVLL